MCHSIYEALVCLGFFFNFFLKIVKTFQGHFASHISYCNKQVVHIIIITEEMYEMRLRPSLSWTNWYKIGIFDRLKCPHISEQIISIRCM